jgi:S-DNA-T family DNA segregation ATPase FtsK/SpoIIIE
LLERRLVLHMPDPLDLTLAGVAPSLAATARPPGRAIDLRTGCEVQLAVPGGGDPLEPAAQCVARAVASGRSTPTGGGSSTLARRRSPWRIRALPERVTVDTMPATGEAVWLGLGGDDAAPTKLPLGPGRRRLVVAGPNRSGRSSSLATIGAGLLEQGRHLAVISPRRSALSAWASATGCQHLTQHDAADLIAARRSDPDLCLLVDDVELVDGSPVEAPLVEVARLVDDTQGVLVVAGELARANGAFRGLVPEVARDGFGILLGASVPADGDVLGVRLDPERIRRPGRGHLVVDGCATTIQVAQLDPTTALTAMPHSGDGRRPAC